MLVILKLVNVRLQSFFKLVDLLRVVGPFALPLTSSPWVPDSQDSVAFSWVIHLLVLDGEDVVKTVGVARHDSRVNAINPDAVLSATGDGAAHKAAILLHVLKILPEGVLVLVELPTSVVDL